jgi:hypothetical protein
MQAGEDAEVAGKEVEGEDKAGAVVSWPTKSLVVSSSRSSISVIVSLLVVGEPATPVSSAQR